MCIVTVLISAGEILNDQIIWEKPHRELAEHFLTLIPLHPTQQILRKKQSKAQGKKAKECELSLDKL